MKNAIFAGVMSLIVVSAAAQAQDRMRLDGWRDFIASANSISGPGYAGESRPAGSKSISEISAGRGECRAATSRTLPSDVRSAAPLLVIGFSSRCFSEGAAVLTVWEPTSANSHRSRTRWDLSAADVGIYTHGPTEGVTIASWMQSVDTVLEKAIGLDPIPSSKLPAWPQGQLIPKLPAGLKWQSGAERELYEAIRAGDYQIYCIYAWQMTCAADVPERNGPMIPILSVRKIKELYEPIDAKAALAILIGDTPPLNPTQLLEAQARIDAESKRTHETMMRHIEAATPQAPAPKTK